MSDNDVQGGQTPTPAAHPGDRPTLHEILLADKLDFEAKLRRAERRRCWLKGKEVMGLLFVSVPKSELDDVYVCFFSS